MATQDTHSNTLTSNVSRQIFDTFKNYNHTKLEQLHWQAKCLTRKHTFLSKHDYV